MATQTGSVRDADATSARGALRLSRGIAATWWYTCAGVLFFAVVLVLVWVSALADAGYSGASVAVVGIGGLVWVLAMVPIILEYYRSRSDGVPSSRWRRAVVPLVVAAAFGVVAGVATGVWIIAVLPLVEMLAMLKWAPGVRRRVVLAATALLGALWFIDARFTFPPDAGASWWLVGFYSTALPAMTVLSLWWWDVLVTLDRARASEARLGATQERLRVATDVHDLQGHHLQVIALQLELAERLLQTDAGEALAHLRAARASVDEARQGTRDLATRFRSVSLGDELANAVDLLRAAGTAAEATVDPDADGAPASVLGPVIRETTTNALRHGGGAWARLSLARAGTSWRFEFSNDTGDAAEHDGPGGAGLEGIGRRVAEAGGALEVRRGKQAFTVVVTVPSQQDGIR